MDTRNAHDNMLLQEVLEQRRAWIKSGIALDSAVASNDETRFVREVIERAQRLRLELAEDRYFARYGL